MTDIEYILGKDIPVIGTTPANIIVAIVVAIVGYFVIEFALNMMKQSMVQAKLRPILIDFTARILRLLLLVFLLGTVLGIVGLNIGPALISFSVVGGFVLGFALADTLSNVASGFMIAITKPFKKDEYVSIGGNEGKVQSVGISLTELNSPDNKRIIIPNKQVWGGAIINYTRNLIRRVDIIVGVSYHSDLNKVIKTTMEILTKDSRILSDPAPMVAVKEMADSSVNLVVRPWVNTADYWNVYWDLQKGIKEAYDAAGIEIPFPQMDVHLQKE